MSIIKPEQLRSGSYSISGSFSGSFHGNGTNVTGVISSSYAQNADLLDGRDSTTYANTGSNIFVGQQVITGSVFVTGSQTINGNLNVSNGIFASGSTSFGSSSLSTHVFTGSLLVTSSHISTVDYIDFNPNITNPGFLTGRVHWTDDTKTLQIDTDVNNFEIEVGHQNVIRVRNTTGGILTKGKIVYINGESGNRPTVVTASWDGDPSSASTLGWVAENINDNQTGYVITNGIIRGINTNIYLPGTQLYLSSSGNYTSTIPISPKHEVRLGKTITQATQGTIYIDVMNGYELGELHDVLITSASNGDLISWNSGSQVWKNTKTLSGSYGISGSLNVTSATGSFSGSFTGNGSGLFSGSFSGSITSNLQEVTDNGSVTTNAITASGIQTNDFHLIGDGTVTGSFTISGSNTFKNIGPAQFTGSVNITGSGILNGSPLVTEAIYNPFTASYYQDSASFDTRILNNSSSIALLSGSYLNSSASFDTRILNNSSSISILSGSYLNSSASFDNRILANSSSIALLSGSFLNTSSSLNIRVTDLENFSSSLDATYATDAQLNAATASLSSSIAYLSGSYLNSSASFNTRILNNSSSIALLSGSYLLDSASFSSRVTTNENSIASLTSKTGSYATTGSNTFIGNQIIDGNITVNGTASVALLYTTYQTSSIIFSSGSTKFGDTLDDTHQFTGSVTITGSDFKWNGDTVLTVTPFNNFTSSYLQDSSSFNSRISNNSSSIAILSGSYLNSSASFDTRILNNSSSISSLSGSYLNSSASFDTRILNNSSSIALLSSSYEAFTDTYNTGSFTGSFTGDGSGLYNISASGIVGLNLSQISSGSVSASISPDSGLQVNTNVTAPSFTGSLFGTASWAENASTASYVVLAQTASYVLNAVSSSYALTASFAQSGNGIFSGSFSGSFVGDGSALTGIVSSKWSGSNPISRDSDVEITGSLRVVGQTTLYTTGSGTLTVQGSGSAQPLFLVTGSVGELLSVTDTDDPNEPLLVVSGSAGQLFVVENSITGSLLQIYNSSSNSVFEINNDAEIIYGVSSSILATKHTTIPTTASYQTIYNINTGSFTGAFVNYTATSASNARAGQLMSVWNSGTASYTETTTMDIGNTSQIAFDIIMTGSVARVAVSASSTTGWQVKTALNIL